jgi:predicted PurR-regulated permease PerM
MNPNDDHQIEFERRLAARMLDVLIRAALIFALAALCLVVFAPFLTLMVWALILAVSLYPLHQALARRMRGKQGLAATVLVLLGLVVVVGPTAVLMSSLGDSIQQLTHDVQNNTLAIPAPPASLATWPVIGERVYGVWTRADTDLPGLIQSWQPKIGELARWALGFVAAIGIGLLQFVAAFIVAGIIMAFGESGASSAQAIFARLAGSERGTDFTRLATQTIRAVAQGVIGVAFIQAIIVGLCLLVAGVPWAGVLSLITLLLGIAQIPALLVTLPAIAYLWMSGHYSTGAAVGFTVLLVVAGMADNVFKPLMLGRGVEAPMPVILLGALGGMATAGILGMFVGATLLALGYQIFRAWVAANSPIDA